MNGQALQSAKDVVDIMERQLQSPGQIANENDNRMVENVFSLMIHLIMEKPLTPIMKDFVNEFIILAASWNENVGRNQKIRSAILDLRRFVDYHLTVIDATQSLKVLTEKVRQMQNFMPPAFELSRHYLEALELLNKENEGKACEGKIAAPKKKLKKSK
jgi:hypothetical protein